MQSAPSNPSPAPLRVPWWKRLLALAVTVAALAWVFNRIEVAQLGGLFRQMDGRWLVAAVAAYGVAVAGVTGRWHLALRCSRMVVHPGATVRLSLIGQPLNLVLLGATGGDVAKSALYARWYRLPFPEVMAAGPLDRLLASAGALLVGLVAVLVAAVSGSLPRSQRLDGAGSVAWWLVGLVGLLAALVGVALWAGRRARRDSGHGRFFGTLADGLQQVVSRPEIALRGLAWGALAQLGLSLCYGCCLEAMGGGFVWTRMFWTLPVISMIAALPSQAGLGVREGGAMAMLSLYGIAPEHAVSAALLTLAPILSWAAAGALVLWQGMRTFSRINPAAREAALPRTLSVVIPTLNETAELPETVARLRRVPEVVEIIVADGGSTDGTAELAAELGCRVVPSAAGRGRQLRAGAAVAGGAVVWLVHADTWVEPEAGRAVLQSFLDPAVVGGGCWKVFRAPAPWLVRGSRLKCALRFFLLRLMLADQALFVRRDVLAAIGGVPDVPLMEEFVLCRALRSRGRLALADTTVRTSARRFVQQGVWRTNARMIRVSLQYWLGSPPETLRRIYERE
jgi:rSAM/selenodomain-associated transferase 2